MATKQFNRTVEAINVLLDKLDGLPVTPMAKKGTILNPSYLPEDATEGDVYLVLYSDSGNAQTANSLYYKTASNWDIIATKGYTPYEIDQMFESIGGGLRWKGAVSYYSNLPSDAELGDMWTVLYEGSSGSEQSGDEYAWGTLNGTEQWILIGKETYSKAQIDDMVDGLTDRIAINENNILSDNIISTSFTWGNGYISTGGHIFASSQSYFSQPFTLHAGEKIVVRTKNKNICIIGSTTADSVVVGDNISILRTTSDVDQEETYDYTATEDIKIVICVLASNYVAYVSNHNTDLLLGSYATAAIKRLESRVTALENQ